MSWTIVLAVCLSAALIGIEVWQMWHLRQASLRNAKVVTVSLAESLSQQADSTLKTADTVVASLVQRVEAEGTGPESINRLYGLMSSLARALPAIHEMGLTDKDGNAIVKSLVPHPVGMNYGERDYFRYLKSHDTREVFIGEPVRSKVDGSLNVTVSRRVNDRDGNFAGVVVTSVSAGFFRHLFESVQTKSGLIGLVSDDGELLASSPGSLGRNELAALKAGTNALEYRAPDGSDRVGSFNHLARYPMTVMVAEDSDAILSEWYAQLRFHGALVVCILGVIGALAYRVEQAHRAMRVQALRDALTGLANRRCFNDTIEREFRRTARAGKPLSLIMIDIDLFKSFNDRYGHVAGDACLCAVAGAVRGGLRRPGDLAARFGGEEIAVLLPETDAAGAAQIIEEMRASLRGLAIPHEASPHRVVTLSAGIASCGPGQPAASWAWLVEAADTALYAAKARGRDAYTVYGGAPAASVASVTPIDRGRAA